MNFRKVVIQKIKEKKLKLTEVSQMTGYSYMYCIDLVRGRRRWNEDTINKFSEALGIEINFTNINQEEPPSANAAR